MLSCFGTEKQHQRLQGLIQVEKTRLIPVDLYCLAICHSRSSYLKGSDRLGGVKICSQKRVVGMSAASSIS